MGTTNFDELMKRYLTNQVTEEESMKIEAWLDTVKTKDTSNLELTPEQEEKLFKKLIDKRDNLRDIKAYHPEDQKKHPANWTLRIAATILLVSLSVFAVKYVVFNDSAQLATTEEKVILNDGTIVWLKANSTISYYEKATGRFADLNGEGLFEVTKDPSRPFTINYKDVNVRVLGTSFTLKTGDKVELKVLTGKVKFFSTTDSVGQEVLPFQQATYTPSKGIEKFELPTADANQLIANTDYNMDFANATFKTVINKLEKKFDVSINLANKEAASCHVTLDITDHSLEQSLKMITAVLNVEYEINNKEITLRGSGCK